MYCPKCGAENPDNAKFCGSCGGLMVIKQDNVPHTANHIQPPHNVQPVTKELKIGITILSVIIPLVGIIMGWIYMTDPNPEKKKVGKQWLYVGIGVTLFYCVLYFIGISSANNYSY